jgi:hypothetical protein
MSTACNRLSANTVVPTAPQLRPQTPSSYAIRVGGAAHVIAHLEAAGWQHELPRSEHELARLRDRGGLIVVYERTVLMQSNLERGRAALAELIEVSR